jgi:hypothetical protein
MATKAKAATDAAAADWRAEMLDRARTIIMSAAPGIVETRKWAKASNNMQGVPVWEHTGIITTGETYKDYVKLTFAHGAKLEDPAGLFNAGFGGGTRRAIDVHQGDKLNEKALKALVKSAVALNGAKKAAPKKAPAKKK